MTRSSATSTSRIPSTTQPLRQTSTWTTTVRNVKSAQNQFPVITQAERMVDRTGEPVEEMIAEERESSSAQIRTLLNEQRKTIIDELTRQKFIEDQKTIMELSGRLQELQNEVNCINDSKDFQDAESVRSGNSHVTSQPGVFPKHPPFEGLLRPSFISQRQTDGPPNTWDTSGISGNVFAHPQASFSAPCPQELNSTWRKTIEEPIHMSTAEKSGRPERDQDLRCQSGPSARNTFDPREGRFSTTIADFGSPF